MRLKDVMGVVRLGLIVAQVPTALMVVYLDLLTLAAARRRAPLPLVPPRARFAILVPAHDEELLLPRLLASCRALDYPPDLFTIHVVADNCTDATATVARGAGAVVHERTDLQLQGKGYALRWLIQRLEDQEHEADAYVLLDADSTISPNLLAVFNAHLARGDSVIQCYYGVLNPDQGWSAALRYVALVLYNELRPRGRDALGLSAGLRGNGMCFAAPIIRRFGWDAFTLAEDAEFHIRLVAAGIRVSFAGDASVMADMPTTLRQSRSQNERWERGRLQLTRSYGPRLLVDSLRYRDSARLDVLAELVTPPLSLLTLITSGWLLLSVALRARRARLMASLVVLGQIGYVWGGLRLAGAPMRTYTAILMAPVFVAWKLVVYVRAALGRRDGRWVRTAR